jgi:HK97 gp10 family phage protein
MKGLDREVQARLASVHAEIRAEVEAVVAECARAVVEQARADCPVASGRLRDSIGAEVSFDPSTGVIEARVYADAPYAAAVELGRGRSAPQPFLFPALEGRGPRLRQVMHEIAR